eukprot:4869987-Prymnesium_polylepis.2
MAQRAVALQQVAEAFTPRRGCQLLAELDGRERVAARRRALEQARRARRGPGGHVGAAAVGARPMKAEDEFEVGCCDEADQLIVARVVETEGVVCLPAKGDGRARERAVRDIPHHVLEAATDAQVAVREAAGEAAESWRGEIEREDTGRRPVRSIVRVLARPPVERDRHVAPGRLGDGKSRLNGGCLDRAGSGGGGQHH